MIYPLRAARVAFLGLLIGWVPSAAQDQAAPPAPLPPYVKPPPDDCHWIVTFSYFNLAKAGSGAPVVIPPNPGQPARMEIAKTGQLRRVSVSMGDGHTLQVTEKDHLFLITAPDGLVQIEVPIMNFAPYPFHTTNFQFTDCVRLSSYEKAEIHDGILCFHYKSNLGEAYINTDTMLPVTTVSPEGVQADFKFVGGDADVQLTPGEQAAVTRYEQSVKQAQAVR